MGANKKEEKKEIGRWRVRGRREGERKRVGREREEGEGVKESTWEDKVRKIDRMNLHCTSCLSHM